MPSAVSVSFARRSTAVTLLVSLPALTAPAVFEPALEVTLSDSVPETLPEVHVTVAGEVVSAANLEQALGPGLRSSFTLRFFSTDRFIVQHLFRARAESPASVHVWVDTTTPGTARLYFSNREGTRYLVRSLELSKPLDEMDREALAQAIEWSLQALMEDSAGMTRAEAEALLSDPSSPSLPKEQARADGRLARPLRRQATGWLPEVALLHRWAPHSPELLGTQGPLLRLGFDRIRGPHQFGFAMSVQYQYPQRHAESGVAIELQTVSSQIDVRYLTTDLIDGSGIGLRLGLGFDAVSSSHEALDWARFEATENRLRGVPLVTGGFVWQVAVERNLRFELSVGTEVDLVNIHYDVATSNGTTRLLSRWPMRPSVSVGVALF